MLTAFQCSRQPLLHTPRVTCIQVQGVKYKSAGLWRGGAGCQVERHNERKQNHKQFYVTVQVNPKMSPTWNKYLFIINIKAKKKKLKKNSVSIVKVDGKRLTKQQNYFGFFFKRLMCLNDQHLCSSRSFAYVRHWGQNCESFAIHVEQVWLMDQVASPLWTEKGDGDTTQMHEQDRVEEDEEEERASRNGKSWKQGSG